MPSPDPPTSPPLIVVGASAGGVEALTVLIATLPPDLDAAVFVVLHVAPTRTTVLPHILARTSALPVCSAEDGMALERGHVYVAPADYHLLIEPGRISLTRGPKENGHRPAIDPTMRTAAAHYEGTVTGVLLSGMRDDGTVGMAAIKAAGGRTLVQAPAEAQFDAMPLSAIRAVGVDAVLPLRDMAAWLRDASGGVATPRRIEHEEPPAVDQAEASGTRFTCPDCGGVLFEELEDNVLRFHCSVGHSYAPASLVAGQEQVMEVALWAAIRSLEDRGVLLDRLAARADGGQPAASRAYCAQALVARANAQAIRDTLRVPEAGAAAQA